MPVLAKGDEGAFKVFFKCLLVVLAFAATLPVLGVGGYLAYRGLFGNEGKTFAERIKKTKRQFPAIELADAVDVILVKP